MTALPLAIIAALALAGCVSLQGGPTAPHTFHILEDAGLASAVRRAEPVAPALLIISRPIDALADTRAIAFSRVRGERNFYQFASWSDRPSRRFAILVHDRLTRRGAFEQIGLLGEGMHSDLILNVRVENLYHDVSERPGHARLEVSAELINRRTRALVDRRRFTHSAPVEREDASGAASAMTMSVARALDALTGWIEVVAARGARP